MNNDTKAILVGAGGHAKVVCDSYLSQAADANSKIIGTLDPAIEVGTNWYRDIEVMGDDDSLEQGTQTQYVLLNGLGHLPHDSGIRAKVYNKFKEQGFSFAKVIDSSAVVSPSATIGEGAQLLAGVIIQADTQVGDNCIINTGAQLDHDCIIGAHSSVAPRAVLCGGVTLGKNVFVGANAVIIQNVVVEDDAVIAAGSVVTKNVAAGQVIYPPRVKS